MPRLIVFNHITLDGYFTRRNGDMSWAYTPKADKEWDEFVANNAKGGGVLVFGRVTYDMMAGYWPTPLAAKNNPVVAEGMNQRQKIVFSRTLDRASWSNTTVIKDDLPRAMRRLKSGAGPDMVILGSGSIIAQLSAERLIDEYQLVVNPLALGDGRTIFDGMTKDLPLRMIGSRAFKNGSVVLNYETIREE
jgi:dihydrofolate reductase